MIADQMKTRLERIKEAYRKAQQAPLMAKAAHIEMLADQMIYLLEMIVEYSDMTEYMLIEQAGTDPEKLARIRKLEEEMSHG